MKIRLLDTTSLSDFTPRNMCFAEPDAAPAGGGSAPAPVADEAPEIDIDPPSDDGGDDDIDMDEFEYEPGRKARIPKPVKELAEMGKDYRYKTGLTAAERKEAAAAREKYQDLIKRTEAALKANEPSKPDESMLDRNSDKYDPDAYHLQRARWERWAQESWNASKERERLEAEDAEKNERARADKKSAAEREIVRLIPAWKDAATRAADEVKMKDHFSRHYGIDKDEFESIHYDHRLAAMAYKTMKYDEAVAKAVARREEPQTPGFTPAPVPRRQGGGSGRTSGPPKDTEGYIKWRKNGGKM